jgi:hypothetical protein
VLWSAVAAAVVVAGLAVAVTLVLTRGGTGGIPAVTDIRATTTGTSVTFRWSDPGTVAGDTYVISSNAGSSQQTGRTFVVDGARGDEECVAVAVNRDGKNGDVSAQKCVTIGDD